MTNRTLPEAIFRELVESGPDAILVVDSEGTIVLANRQVKLCFGYDPEELEGQKIEVLVPAAVRARHVALRQGFTSNQKSRPMGAGLSLAAARKDGSEFPVEIMLAPLAQGLVAAVVRDITGRQRVAEQQAEIKRLKDIADFRARFLNVAAHELKTPLTPIRMQIQILQQGLKDADPGVTKSLHILKRGVDRLQTLMQDVLDAARIQADHLNVRKDTVSLSDVATEAVENYAAVAQGVDIALTSSIQAGVHVVGDSERLLQVTTNLISNAVKFTIGGGQVRLTLRTEGERALLAVTDTGRGMTPDQLGQLFEPFAQVHPDLQATVKGTGLGLYISRAIVQQHGGEITLTSGGPGQGTTAAVRLPITADPVASVPVQPKARSFDQRLREMV